MEGNIQLSQPVCFAKILTFMIFFEVLRHLPGDDQLETKPTILLIGMEMSLSLFIHKDSQCAATELTLQASSKRKTLPCDLKVAKPALESKSYKNIQAVLFYTKPPLAPVTMNVVSNYLLHVASNYLL